MRFVFKAEFKITHWLKTLGLAAVWVTWVTMAMATTVGASPSGKGVITAHKLNIRTAPARSASVVVMVEKGETVDILDVQGGIGGWLKVRYNGNEGFVRHRPEYIATDLAGPIEPAIKTIKRASLKPKPANLVQSKPAQTKTVIKDKIEEESRKVADFSDKETKILEGLDAIDYALSNARVRTAKLRRETHALSHEMDHIQGRISELSQAMDSNQAYAGTRLNALYRLHMMGSLEMAGPPASLFEFFVVQNALKKIVASDFSLLEKQERDLKELGRLEKELTRQMASRTQLEEELAVQIRIREKESHKKSVLLQEIRQKKKLSQSVIAALASSAKALDTTIGTMAASQHPDLKTAAFAQQKGRLNPPVRGKVISRYGKARKGDYNAFTFQSGIDIRVARGEPVHSVFNGEIMFAQWIKGYGNVLIINHGDNYYTLYAHVEEMFKKKGERVETGEVIATAGDTGSIKGLCLHFEVRHHGKPVNPMTWLKKGA